MKKLTVLCTLIFSCMMLFSGCDFFPSDEKDPTYTVSFKVDGVQKTFTGLSPTFLGSSDSINGNYYINPDDPNGNGEKFHISLPTSLLSSGAIINTPNDAFTDVSYKSATGTDFIAVTGINTSVFTITIISYSASKVKGTFYGNLQGLNGTATVIITEGSFEGDIEFQ